ncbi:methionine aminopeptidase [Flexivirga caeni]|uniref:Methionine aminopeptidase n=2 Tax=Flexivirga caeni TaxID=2294115 RepID=A0A3M9M6K3_9MICO|nr:methionine aminopeptidase [Flexivirga caeni]
MAFWYDVEKNEVVESHRDGLTHGNLMGPYDTADAARNALKTAAERTAKWDKEDEEWNDR